MSQLSLGLNKAVNEEYPLHFAASRGDVGSLYHLLLSRGYNVNQANYNLSRPLHEACLWGHYECCVLLCKHGADVNLQNIDGAPPLCDACCNGNLDCIELLLKEGAVVNPPFLLISPLHEAIRGNNYHCIQKLLRYGALLESCDLDYGTPLQFAVKKGFFECARILLQSGANVNVSKNHETPLHSAAKLGDARLVHLLLTYGANIYPKDAKGKEPIHLVSNQNDTCFTVLAMSCQKPRSLRQLCRLKIRKSVGVANLSSLEQLRLPRIITRFLEYS